MRDIIVMHAEPFDSGAVNCVFEDPALPAGLIAETPYAVTLYGDTTDVYAAEIGYNTEPGDTPANTHMPGVLTKAFEYSIQLFADVDLLRPGAAAGSGQLIFSDPSGRLDSWLDYGWDGRPITLYRGDPNAAFSTFNVVARLTSDGWEEVSHRTKALKIRDLGWRLDAPLPLPRYAGTGGAEGGSEIAGMTKPFVIDLALYVPLTLVDAPNLIYHYHATEVAPASPLAFTVGGVGWTANAAGTTYQELRDATVGAGTVGRADDVGLAKYGSAPPQGQEQRISAIMGPEIPDALDALAALSTASPPITFDISTPWMDTAQFGWYVPSSPTPPTFAELLNDLFYPLGAYWWSDLSGTIHVRELTDPADETADIEIDCSRPYVLASEPKIIMPVPRYSVSLQCHRAWAVQSRASLAGSVDVSEADVVSREWRVRTIESNVGTRVRHRHARFSIANTAIVGTDNARNRAYDLLALFGTQRYILTARFGEMDPLDPPIGRIIDLQNLNRFGFGASKKGLCIGARASSAKNSLELTLFL